MILDKKFFKEKQKKKAASSRTKINFRIKLFKPNKGFSARRISLVQCRVLSRRIAMYKIPAVAPVSHLL